MDLKIFFSPIEEEHFAHIKQANSFYKNIKVYTDKMPKYREADIAIIGVNEEAGTEENKGTAKGCIEIRKKLFNLKKGQGNYKIVDMGTLRNGVDLAETIGRIKEVCQNLIENNVLPLIIGGSHDLDYGQYQAYEDLDKLISLINIDAFLDMEDSSSVSASQQHIHKILLHEPNYLFNYSHLAYQSYLIDPNAIAILEKLYFEAYRIGHLRANIQEMEPIIRNADMLSFDITAIKSSDAPGNANAQPFGLTGEEACQICWYAGLNEKLSSAGFYEYNPLLDDSNQKTASVIATMIWYFIEGFYNRKNDQNFKNNDYLKFVVSMPSEPEVLHFYKSKISEKWWMEVPYPQGKEKYARNCIIPCSYTDYQTATKGELPERYITTHAKLI
ncbi:formimidoylglutamase [Fulvivirga sediminis]|uniref:Formimidoylglutamase n=1 Tax=Fulvivirga sediminis TaxID=2803949 RepID=A0A937FA09_9BACT|nr:formimidoylglutamase [Fulvivirga sediminis]MBL3657034.1 formimidoylglutamase [Fulvivirga sediminis]